jgi:hypothetical protein
LCCAGDFNLSHASLTSAPVLFALRKLPNTNPTLYHEITSSRMNKTTTEDEQAFSDKIETKGDGSDISVNVVQSVIMSAGSVSIEGFGINEGGDIIRTGAVEEFEGDMEEDGNALPLVDVLWRGHRAKIESTKYGTDWEEH